LNNFKIWLIGIPMLAGVLLSCSDFNQREQLRALENMTNTTDSLLDVIKNGVPDSLNTMRQTMLNTEIALKNKVTMDTVDMRYSVDMDTYNLAINRIGKIYHHRLELDATLKKEKKQLANLKNDIEKGWGKRSEYNQYIKLEEKNIKALTTKTQVLQKETLKVCEVYRLLHPKMKTLLRTVIE